jgi:hypothetical protein
VATGRFSVMPVRSAVGAQPLDALRKAGRLIGDPGARRRRVGDVDPSAIATVMPYRRQVAHAMTRRPSRTSALTAAARASASASAQRVILQGARKGLRLACEARRDKALAMIAARCARSEARFPFLYTAKMFKLPPLMDENASTGAFSQQVLKIDSSRLVGTDATLRMRV